MIFMCMCDYAIFFKYIFKFSNTRNNKNFNLDEIYLISFYVIKKC